MKCILHVPVEGLMELFIPGGGEPEICKTATARIQLSKDDDTKAVMVYDHTNTDRNPRATKATGKLCDSYVQGYGAVAFEGVDEAMALAIMLDLR